MYYAKFIRIWCSGKESSQRKYIQLWTYLPLSRANGPQLCQIIVQGQLTHSMLVVHIIYAYFISYCFSLQINRFGTELTFWSLINFIQRQQYVLYYADIILF